MGCTDEELGLTKVIEVLSLRGGGTMEWVVRKRDFQKILGVLALSIL